jgi:hypothetical protein
MRLTTSAIVTIVTAGLLAGCSGSNLGSSLPSAGPRSQIARDASVTPVSMIPAWMQPAGVKRLRLNDVIIPNKQKKSIGLIYASEFYGEQLYGYPNPNSNNGAPTCELGSASNPLEDVNGFGTDTKGNVMVPYFSGSGYRLTVFKPNCGKSLWSASVTNGQPADAYATNASRRVLVSEIVNDSRDAGALVFCSKKSGCGTPFANPSITGYGGGVAMAKNGDCWLSAESASFTGFVLAYFKGCSGSGEVATGTSNAYYGGLFVDKQGNLGSIDLSGYLYVYKGCNPACTLLSKSVLQGESIFGGLDKKGTSFVAGDFANNDVDIYSYSATKGLTYSYSFNNSLQSGGDDETAQYAPTNQN